MRYLKGNNALYIILGLAVIALLFGFLVVKKRINTKPQTEQQQNEQKSEDNQNVEPKDITPSNTTGWLSYVNDKHGFSVKYPAGLKVGAVSANSVLGTFQLPVKGFHVGSLVFVVLKDAEVKQQANDYFNESYDLALHPPTDQSGAGCVAHKVENSAVVSVKSVSCVGEGGPARYAYIKGKDYDIFVDGYSNGYENADFGKLASDADYIAVLVSFKFTAAVITATPTPPDPNSSIDAPPPQSAIQSFSVTANDNGADLTEINVAKGTIVEITFHVSSQGDYYGGLDFRSSVINTGTIVAGSSKTISFKADKSFSFTPYWPSSNVAKDYKIKITVQ